MPITIFGTNTRDIFSKIIKNEITTLDLPMHTFAKDLSRIHENSHFDVQALAAFLRREVEAFEGVLDVAQFRGGQSNPTYRIQAGQKTYVMRKKPVGTLLPSAHAIDREFRVMKALAKAHVLVPRMRALCEDSSVIGQAFYVMDFVEGRVFHDRQLPGCSRADRAAMYAAMVENLARLSRVDIHAVGLDDFGCPNGYVARQVGRWSKQYLSAGLEPCLAMNWLITWLSEHEPQSGDPAVIHGDYRIGNLLFHPVQPEVSVILDWELSTIGEPLADLAYNVMCYFLPKELGGFLGVDIAALGIPDYDNYVARYCKLTNRNDLPDFTYYIVFSMFRSAAIEAGVYRRALEGNAADPTAIERGKRYQLVAEHARSLAESTKLKAAR